MKNTDYLRLKNVELGYTIPAVKKVGIQDLRVYVNATNLFTIDGVKVSFEDRKEWVHLRRSNTEPIIRIYAEAATEEAANALAAEVIDIAKKIIG